MKLTTLKIVEAYDSLKKLYESDFKFPTHIAWNLDENFEKFEVIVNRFNKERDKLLAPLRNENAFMDIGDGKIQCKQEYLPEFKKVMDEIDAFLQLENDIYIITIGKSFLPSEMSLHDLRSIKFMIATDD